MRTKLHFAPVALAAVVLANNLEIPEARAGHCPEELRISGAPEHILAGVDATRDRLDRVVKLFGRPKGVHEFEDSSYPPGSGEAEYTWSLGDATLKVLTIYHHDLGGKKVEAVQAVKVMGRSASPCLRTGRGVGLGAKRDQVTLAYGSTSFKGSLTGAGPEAATITFCFRDETSLEFTFDDADHVIQVYLAPSAE